MFDNPLFVPQFVTGQAIKLRTQDGVMIDSCDANIGYLQGDVRKIKAILCDGAHESDQWQVINLVRPDGTFYDHIAVKGAVSQDQAERLCQKYFLQGQGDYRFQDHVPVSDNSLKMFMDSTVTPTGTSFFLLADAVAYDARATQQPVIWDDENRLQSHGGHIAQVMYDMARYDANQDLLTKVTPKDVVSMLLDENCTLVMYDAMIMKYRQLDMAMKKLAEALKTSDHEEFFVKSVTPIEPFKRLGVVNVGVIFEMSDTQTVTVLFNNPDTTPGKITDNDVITSWKWILNKRDVTAVLQPRAVDAKKYPLIASRMFKLLAQNHSRFKRAQALRAKDEALLSELMGQLEAAQSESNSLDAELARIDQEIDQVGVRKQQQSALESGNEKPLEVEVEAIESQGNQPDIALTGDEFGEFDTSSDAGRLELRNKAIGYLQGLAESGTTVFCPALNADVGFSKKNIKKFKKFSANPIKLKLASKIEQIIANGQVFKPSETSYFIKEVGTTYHYLKTKVFVAGEEYGARCVIREDDKGVFHYDMQVAANFDAILDSANKIGDNLELSPNATTYKPSTHAEVNSVASSQPYVLHHSSNINQLDENGQAILDDAGQSAVGNYVLNLFLFDKDGNEIKDDIEQPDEAPAFEVATTRYRIKSLKPRARKPVGSIRLTTRPDGLYEVLITYNGVSGEYVHALEVIKLWIANRMQGLGSALEGKDPSFEDIAPRLELVEGEDLLGVVVQVPADDPAPLDDPAPADEPAPVSEDEQFLNDLIAGLVDLAADETGARLESMAEGLDPALESLFEQAAEAYAQFAINNAKTV